MIPNRIRACAPAVLKSTGSAVSLKPGAVPCRTICCLKCKILFLEFFKGLRFGTSRNPLQGIIAEASALIRRRDHAFLPTDHFVLADLSRMDAVRTITCHFFSKQHAAFLISIRDFSYYT